MVGDPRFNFLGAQEPDVHAMIDSQPRPNHIVNGMSIVVWIRAHIPQRVPTKTYVCHLNGNKPIRNIIPHIFNRLQLDQDDHEMIFMYNNKLLDLHKTWQEEDVPDRALIRAACLLSETE